MSWNSSTMIERKRQLSRSRTVGVVAQQIARAQLEVLEVERRLAVLRRAVGGAEALEQLLEQIAVAGGELVERGLLDRRRASS